MQTIAMLQESLGRLGKQQTQSENDQNVQDEIVRPLLKSLVDTYDALSIAERQVKRLLDRFLPLTREARQPPPIVKLKPRTSALARLDASIEPQLALLYECQGESGCAPLSADAGQRYQQSIEALLTGYRMSLQRIDRAFESYSVEAFPCVGETFDPELMEVAEVMRDESVTRIEVIEELRRGYLWRGRLFRCAQVRVARP